MILNQLHYLFICNFGILFIGTGLLPILPLYGAQFGASPGGIGLYLGNTYFAITAGTILTSWLTARVSHRRLLIGTGFLGIPAVVLLGQATAFWQVVLLTAIIWFLGGIGLTLISILTGNYAGDQKRGRSFGLLFLAHPAAMLLSGVLVGLLLERQGFGLTFAAISLAWALYPAAAYLRPVDDFETRPARVTRTEVQSSTQITRPFYALLLVMFLLQSVSLGSRLGLTLSMKSLDFSAGAIGSTSVVVGFCSILYGLAVSAWSDRLGWKLFLAFGTLGAACGALLLTFGTQLWQFWLATSLLSAGNIVTGAVIPALATELLDPGALNRGLTRLSSINRVSGVVGFVATGYVIETFGLTASYAIAVVLAVIAAAVSGLLPGREGKTTLGLRKISSQIIAGAGLRRQPALVRRA